METIQFMKAFTPISNCMAWVQNDLYKEVSKVMTNNLYIERRFEEPIPINQNYLDILEKDATVYVSKGMI
jgi:cob(I)alamin adenosyltransferase